MQEIIVLKEIQETILINWVLVFSHFLWILGAAVITSVLAWHYFSAVKRNPTRTSGNGKRKYAGFMEFVKTPFIKKMLFFSVLLIICGLLINRFKIPHKKLIIAQVNQSQLPQLDWQVKKEPLHFPPSLLKMDGHNKGHTLNGRDMRNNTMMLFWDGFIQTPFLRFNEGDYQVKFRAKGTPAKKEFPQIKVEFEIPDKNGYLFTKRIIYFKLSPQMKTYNLKFNVPKSQTVFGRIRITYFNDLHIRGTKRGRDLWLKDVHFIRM